ncbi:MAG: hypothetical protein RSD36_17815, partial [Terrisporobacter sp.]
MIQIKNVRGSMDVVPGIEFNVDTIYERSNIIRLEDLGLWQYDEVQYSYREWIEKSHNRIENLNTENKSLNTQLDVVKSTHSDLIFDIDFRVMDIEDNLGIVPATTKNIIDMVIEGENNMTSTCVMLLDKIESGNYKNKVEVEDMAERYLNRNRISIE